MDHGHKTDTLTGGCAACGVTREEIDDNLAGPCLPVDGPDRLAIIALRREIRHRQHNITTAEREAVAAERQAAMRAHHLTESLCDLRAELYALQESLGRLMSAEPCATALELGAEVRRLGLSGLPY